MSVLVGAFGTAAGLWIKTLGCRPDGFWIALTGQALVSVATNFVVSSAPPRMAAVWFPPHQVATAVGSAMLVIMLGIAFGCATAPLTVSDDQTPEETFYGLLIINVALAVVGTLLLVAVYFLFQDAPPLPPSPSQAVRAPEARNAMSFLRSLGRIGRDPHFVLLLLSCGLFSSVFIAFSASINRAVVTFHPDNGADAGWIGMIMTLAGIVGIVLVALLVDKTRLYKEWAVIIYSCALLGAVAYSVTLSRSTIVALYCASALMGFFMPCFYVPGFALAVELTYPEPEGNPTAIINWLIQPSALVVKLVYSQVFEVWGADVAHAVQCSLLVIGLVCVATVPKKYRRREAERLAHVKEVNGEDKAPEATRLTAVD